MATLTSPEATSRRRVDDRPLFLIVAVAFPIFVFAGFARTFYLKPFIDAPPLPSYVVHLHGLAMTAWVALFIAQVWLVRANKVKVHQQLGLAGIGVAIAVVIMTFFTSVAAAKYGSPSFPKEVPAISFAIMPLMDLVVFPSLFGAAMYYRKRSPANHKRLMLLTVLIFLPAPLARLPIIASAASALGPGFFFGVPVLLAIITIVWDARRNGLNKVFAIAAALWVLSIPLRIALSGTTAWINFATGLTRFALT